jgi:hypothetical protein
MGGRRRDVIARLPRWTALAAYVKAMLFAID